MARMAFLLNSGIAELLAAVCQSVLSDDLDVVHVRGQRFVFHDGSTYLLRDLANRLRSYVPYHLIENCGSPTELNVDPYRKAGGKRSQ